MLVFFVFRGVKEKTISPKNREPYPRGEGPKLEESLATGERSYENQRASIIKKFQVPKVEVRNTFFLAVCNKICYGYGLWIRETPPPKIAGYKVLSLRLSDYGRINDDGFNGLASLENRQNAGPKRKFKHLQTSSIFRCEVMLVSGRVSTKLITTCIIHLHHILPLDTQNYRCLIDVCMVTHCCACFRHF